MHIAICDDNIADRKQLERLLDRESDKRKADTGVFYTDSYGDPTVLARNPMPYDLFFIDLAGEGPDGLSFALQLRRMGVTVPIVLCSSRLDYQAAYQALTDCPYEFLFLSKAIRTKELSTALDAAIEKLHQRIPTIELRSDTDTIYVQEDDILYALSEGQYVHVFLKDNRDILLLTDMLNFYSTVDMFSHMVLLTGKALINISYLESYTPFRVTLKGGTVIKSSPLAVKYIKLAQKMPEDQNLL